MNLFLFRTVPVICLFLFVQTSPVFSQSYITKHKNKINLIDKKGRKQGDWIFFDSTGSVLLSCRFENDKLSGPVCWYENNDTVFLRFPAKDNRETFVLVEKGHQFVGDFILQKDSSWQTELDPDSSLNETVLNKIKYYRTKKTKPLFYFGDKKLADYVSMAFNSSRFHFNKPIYVLISVDESGKVKDVTFPPDINRLSHDEERDLYTIFIGMPRWQPVFDQNRVVPVKIMLSRNTVIKYMN